MRNHNYFVYILTNRPNGTLYIGVTNNLTRRLFEHRQGTANSFARRYNCNHLVWFEHHSEITQAILREKRIKKWNRTWKVQLIEAANPTWDDLAVAQPTGLQRALINTPLNPPHATKMAKNPV